MNAANEATTVGPRRIQKAKRDLHLSKDGKWRSFPKVPNLLQYVISGTYYARRKTDGKSVRVSLETKVFTVAKLRLPPVARTAVVGAKTAAKRSDLQGGRVPGIADEGLSARRLCAADAPFLATPVCDAMR